MEFHHQCPVCTNNQLKPYLEVADYFLTQEKFQLQKCEQCDLVLTNPYPDKDHLPKYYESNDYFSHPNKKQSIFSFLYNSVKILNLRYKYKVATSGLEVGRILDIGCGAGDFLSVAKNNGWAIEGVEPNQEARKYTAEKLGKQIFSIEEFNLLNDHSFDVITMWHVLEHVEDINQQALELQRLLKPGGRLIIALPNICSFDAEHYGKYWAGWDVPRHLFHFSFTSIQSLLKKHGFLFLKREPLRWDAFYISMLSEKYKNKRVRPLLTLLNGCKSNTKAKKTREYSSNIYIFVK